MNEGFDWYSALVTIRLCVVNLGPHQLAHLLREFWKSPHVPHYNAKASEIQAGELLSGGPA